MNKLMLGGIVVCVLLLLSDLTNRFMPSEQQSQNNFNASATSAQPLPLLSKTALSQLTQLYSQFAEPETPAETEQGLTAAQQAEQQGELLSLFAGDLELKLKAVIYAAEPYVLIEQKNIKTQQTTLVKYLNEQSVQGYTLNIVSNTQVSLSKAQQHITLVMYQRG
jgi:Na+-transporting methylmalonyl-CoA/oxaloacetate decarboxylase gamma subunit